MRFTFQESLAADYISHSQKARVLTEHWVGSEVFCPSCGNSKIKKYPNNQPVADFYCTNCEEDFELKSKNGAFGSKVADGAYRAKIRRLTSRRNPSLFLLSYNRAYFKVSDFMVIPKHFFVPEIIEKRSPLRDTARRAGWVGSNILLNTLPDAGKIYLVKDSNMEPRRKVLSQWRKTLFLRNQIATKEKRGWTLDVMKCIELINKRAFTLDDVYAFEDELSKAHPQNRYIRDKIRQQLQILRDKGYIEFTARGNYKII